MDSRLQLFVLIVIGFVLLWFGFALFFRTGKRRNGEGAERGGGLGKRRYKPEPEVLREGGAGSPRSCPVCGLLLPPGGLVKSSVFPDPGNGRGRLMHIEGCAHCLEGRWSGKRKCPVCGTHLTTDEILFARMFDKPGRSHVHVLGCSRCRGPGRR
ncbi:MAG: hypothetical protein LBH70_06305 [Spirochaetaceae bacterium]|nr:hypothetical protein [Spirochaetaceae bacterium]